MDDCKHRNQGRDHKGRLRCFDCDKPLKRVFVDADGKPWGQPGGSPYRNPTRAARRAKSEQRSGLNAQVDSE